MLPASAVEAMMVQADSSGSVTLPLTARPHALWLRHGDQIIQWGIVIDIGPAREALVTLPTPMPSLFYTLQWSIAGGERPAVAVTERRASGFILTNAGNDVPVTVCWMAIGQA